MRVVSLMVSSPHTEVRPITRDQGTHERAGPSIGPGGEERRVRVIRVTQNRIMKKQE